MVPKHGLSSWIRQIYLSKIPVFGKLILQNAYFLGEYVPIILRSYRFCWVFAE